MPPSDTANNRETWEAWQIVKIIRIQAFVHFVLDGITLSNTTYKNLTINLQLSGFISPDIQLGGS